MSYEPFRQCLCLVTQTLPNWFSLSHDFMPRPQLTPTLVRLYGYSKTTAADNGGTVIPLVVEIHAGSSTRR